MVVGVAVTLAPTLGLTVVDAERSTSVAVADDGSALLALESTEAVVDSRDGTTAGILRNNAGQSLTVDYTVSVGTKDLTVETSDGVGVALSDGEGIDVDLSCRPGNKQAMATLQVTVSTATGSTVSIEDAVLTRTVDYNCPPGGGGPPPGKGPAFNDADGDGVYDEGETTYRAAELRSYDNDSADLVISDAGTIDMGNRKVSITAKSTTIRDSTLTSKQSVSVEAESGDVTFQNAVVESRKNKVTVTGPTVSADSSTISSKNELSLNAESGPATLSESTLSSSKNKVTVGGSEVRAARTTIDGKNEITLTGNAGPVDVTDATVDSRKNKVTVDGSSVSARKATISGKNEITLTGNSGPVDVTGATVDSRKNKVTIDGSSVSARGATIEADNEITVTGNTGLVDIDSAKLTSQTNKITVSGASVSAGGATISGMNEIVVTSGGDLGVSGTMVTSEGNKITLTAEGGVLDATGATIEADSEITLTSDGDMTLADAEVTSRSNRASGTLNRETGTLSVDGLSISDNDDTLTYSPSGVSVEGDTTQGDVAPG